MSTDRELLELAAKALGLTAYNYESNETYADCYGNVRAWNPLAYDEDALRLAVKLRLVCCAGEHPIFTNDSDRMAAWADKDVMYGSDLYQSVEWSQSTGDPYAATRRAIVRAAAEIGRSMK